MKHRYLIFGNGFIASNYARHLIGRGEDVRVIFHAKMNPALPQKIQRRGSVSLSGLRRLLSSFDPHYILLTQGISFVPDNEKELYRSVESNVVSPLTVMEAAYKLREEQKLLSLKKVMTFGSAAEYGDAGSHKWSESVGDTHPSSLYGLVKHWLFEASRFYADLGLPCIHLRHFNAMGAGQDSRFVVSSFCRQVALIEHGKQKPKLMVGDLTQERDFIDIRDAARAYDIALTKAEPGQVVNICSGTTRPVRDVIATLKKLSAIPFSVSVDPRLFAHKRTRNKKLGGTPAWLEKNGWRPNEPFADSVKNVLDYWRDTV